MVDESVLFIEVRPDREVLLYVICWHVYTHIGIHVQYIHVHMYTLIP